MGRQVQGFSLVEAVMVLLVVAALAALAAPTVGGLIDVQRDRAEAARLAGEAEAAHAAALLADVEVDGPLLSGVVEDAASDRTVRWQDPSAARGQVSADADGARLSLASATRLSDDGPQRCVWAYTSPDRTLTMFGTLEDAGVGGCDAADAAGLAVQVAAGELPLRTAGIAPSDDGTDGGEQDDSEDGDPLGDLTGQLPYLDDPDGWVDVVVAADVGAYLEGLSGDVAPDGTADPQVSAASVAPVDPHDFLTTPSPDSAAVEVRVWDHIHGEGFVPYTGGGLDAHDGDWRYTIRFEGIEGFNGADWGQRSHVAGVLGWGGDTLTSLASAFAISPHNVLVPEDLPPNVKNVANMFLFASAFNRALDGWDTGSVTNMQAMFDGASSFNQDLDGWDTGSVEDMSRMFMSASAFNGDIGGWDTGSVASMSGMFLSASAFNRPLDGWDTGSVTSMQAMFDGASSFNQDLDGWDTSSVEDMSDMFMQASAFNGDIGGWDTGSVTSMREMFRSASAFNRPLDGWDTGRVANMAGMFHHAALFDQPIGGWDTGGVRTMQDMFRFASAFNQPLDSWDTGSVTSIEGMFAWASSFNQDLDGWDTGQVATMKDTFRFAENFAGSVSGWDTSSVKVLRNTFMGADAFNGDVSAWDVSGVDDVKVDPWNTPDGLDLSGWDLTAAVCHSGLDGLDPPRRPALPASDPDPWCAVTHDNRYAGSLLYGGVAAAADRTAAAAQLRDTLTSVAAMSGKNPGDPLTAEDFDLAGAAPHSFWTFNPDLLTYEMGSNPVLRIADDDRYWQFRFGAPLTSESTPHSVDYVTIPGGVQATAAQTLTALLTRAAEAGGRSAGETLQEDDLAAAGFVFAGRDGQPARPASVQFGDALYRFTDTDLIVEYRDATGATQTATLPRPVPAPGS